MRKVLLLVVALAGLAATAAPAATHPPVASVGGVVIGTDSVCSTQVEVQLFAHYIDVTGRTKNQVITTATSTCTPTTARAIVPTVNTLVRLYNQYGSEIGTPLSCSNAMVCQRTDWLTGSPADQFKAAGAAIWRLPSGNNSAWFQCVGPTFDGIAQTGFCSLSSDPKWAAISSYTNYHLI